MLAIMILSLIIGWWLGFFTCALFKVDGQAPRPLKDKQKNNYNRG